MITKLIRTPVAEGVSLSVLSDPKFKHNRLSVHFIVPLNRETVTGYALLPFLLRKGCQSCPDFTELNRRLDHLYGASLSADIEKAGASQIVTLSITSVADRFTLDGEALLVECAALLRDVALSPCIENGAFPESDVMLEKQNLIDTIEAEVNDKRSYALLQCRALLGGDDPAALRRYGSVQDAKCLTPRSAAESYRQLMKHAAVELMFVGPGDPSAAITLLEQAFVNIPRSPAPFAMPRVVARAETVREQVERLEVAQSKLVMGFRTGESGDVDHQAALRLMVALYGGTPSSKLFLNVRERLSLCYYCAARMDRASALMMVDSGVEQANIEQAKKEILHQFEDVKNGLFEDETLENTRLMLKNSLRAVGDSAGALEDWYLNRILCGPLTSPAEELERLERVTREQVIEAARGVTLDTVYLLTAKEGQ